MELTYLDRSTYFKGLLLLIKRDKRIAKQEIKLIKKIGKVLGFEKSFIKSSVDNLLENKYLTDDIPVFSDKLFAESFILDGLKLSFSDDDFSAEELEYLTSVAKQNSINRDLLMVLLKNYLKFSDDLNSNEFLFVSKYMNNTKTEKIDY